MKVEIKGKLTEVTNGMTVKLENGKTITVTGDFQSHIVGRTESNELVIAKPTDIIEIIQIIAEVLPLIDRIIKMIKGWFGK